MGVGMVMRTAASAIKPTVVVEKNGNQWTLKTLSTLKNTELTATEGVEFEESKLNRHSTFILRV